MGETEENEECRRASGTGTFLPGVYIGGPLKIQGLRPVYPTMRMTERKEIPLSPRKQTDLFRGLT